MHYATEIPKNKERIDPADDERKKTTSELNNPKVDEDGLPTMRAITSPQQAHAIAKALYDRAETGRIKTAAIISDKYNGGLPFDASELLKLAQGWRNNFSTNWFASIADRVMPQLRDPLNKAELLTHSSLPPSVENGATKSRKFCEVTTRTIRRWNGWRDFTSGLSQEVIVYGSAAPVHLDPNDWRPHLPTFGEVFLPEGTGQHASKVQVVVVTERKSLHDFLGLLREKKAAERAGYDLDGCRKAANNSSSSREMNKNDLEREDDKREGNSLVDSISGQSKTIDLYHVMVLDYTGEVDLWTVTQDDGTEIRNVQNLYDGGGMDDCLTLFTFQAGNKRFYGSKGLGRLLCNLHIAIERGRCLGADQMYLSGLIIGSVDKMDAINLQTRVRHPFVFVSKGVTLQKEQIGFNAEAFEMMDNKLGQIGESIAGAFIPPNIDQAGSPNTKIEAAQRAERELAVKDGVLGRFFGHAHDLISSMQRKIYSHINLREGVRAHKEKGEKTKKGIKVIMRKVWKLVTAAIGKKEDIAPETEIKVADEEAVNAIVELLESGLTIEEIATLALSPAASSNEDEGADKDNRTLGYIAANKMNPNIDQRKASEMEAKLVLGEDRATQLLIPTEDPNVEAAAVRQQVIEWSEMMIGNEMPVVGTDAHFLHRKALTVKLTPVIESLATIPTKDLIIAADLGVRHYAEHVQMDMMTPDEQKKAEMQALQAWVKAIEVGKQLYAQHEAAAAQQGSTAEQLPVPVQGQPPQVGPNGQIAGENKLTEADGIKAIAEMKKLEQKDRELDLRAGQQEHDQLYDAVQLQQGNLKIAQEAAKAELEQGKKEGKQDLIDTL